MSKDDDFIAAGSATEVATILDEMAKQLGRKVRVYVIGHKERSRTETTRLIKSADIAVEKVAWDLLDDPSRYEWVNP
jgi:hypothetical protein